MRHIVFVGTCQLEALHGLFARHVVPLTEDKLTYIPSYDRVGPSHMDALRRADLIVEQLQDFECKADIEAADISAERQQVPLVAAGFLWPLAGQPHPGNKQLPPGTAPRFTQEMSDSFLNRMIAKGVDPHEAVKAYLTLDLNRMFELDRLYEVSISQQRKRDQATGYDLATLIEQHFRHEHIFATQHHPRIRVMRALAEQFFEHMGVSRPVIDRMLRHLRTPPLVADELPIHPSVSRHFGLDFLGDDPAWRFTEEGRFSTEAFYLKYMRFEWNRDLEAGLALWHHGELESAMERLNRALSRSPRAAKAYFIQSLILWRWNRRDDAVLNARCAVELEPGEPEFRLHLASLLVDLAAGGGRREEFLRAAEQEARTAVQLDLGSWHALGVLSHVLEQQGRYAEAVEPLGDAIALEPEGADFHARFGHLHEHLNEFGTAEKAYRRAVELSQGEAHYVRVLNHFLIRRSTALNSPG